MNVTLIRRFDYNPFTRKAGKVWALVLPNGDEVGQYPVRTAALTAANKYKLTIVPRKISEPHTVS